MPRCCRLYLVIVFAAVLSLLATSTTMAASPAGDAPNDVVALKSGWVELSGSQSQWYRFHTDAVVASGTDQHILVDLTAEPPGSATFSVWTREALLASLGGDRSARPLGNGAPAAQNDSGGELVWDGASNTGQVYLVGVQPASSSPSRYLLRISGPHVSSSEATDPRSGWWASSVQTLPAILDANSPAGSAKRQSYAGPGIKVADGATPASAFKPDGLIRDLGAGQQHWYAFKHIGPGASPGRGTDGTTISILLNAYPQGSATFSVWTDAEVQALAAGDRTTGVPVGRGTLHPVNGDNSVDRFGGSPQWAGKFNVSGTYYVLVEQTGNTSGSYSLVVSSGSKPQ